ncbi:MAG: AAA family ATPase [Spirochaetota bacterium]
MPLSIAVAGKGGTGKSTIAALVVLYLCQKNLGPVLAVDADPDANLGTMLGIKVTKTLGQMREEVLEEIKNFPPGMSKPQYIEAGLHQIIDEAEGFDLLTMGRGEGPGCYCYLNSLIRKFSEELFPVYTSIVMDNEAGLEHLSRRTTSNVDALIVVVNDNPISVATARNIERIVKDIKTLIGRKYVVTNMVKEQRKSLVINQVKGLDMEYLGDIPYDQNLEDLIYQGRSLRELEASPVKDHIKYIVDTIGGRNGHT